MFESKRPDLFPYQSEGAKWLATKNVAILADEMGLGKSAQAITACDLINAKRICVVCPSIAKYNWHREFEIFSQTKRTFDIIGRREEKWDEEKSIITSFDCANAVKLSGVFDVLIIDEAHFVKSTVSKRASAILGKNGLARCSNRVWALTGTPMPNHPGEMWTLLYTFGATGYSHLEFVKRFCNHKINRFYKGPKNTVKALIIEGAKRENIEELKLTLSKVMLRRLKENVMKELPPIFYSTVIVEPSPVDIEEHVDFGEYVYPVDRTKELEDKLNEERHFIETVMNKVTETASRGMNLSEALTVLSNMIRSIPTLRRYTGLQKVDAVCEIISSELDANAYSKIVIFAIHKDVIEALRQRLRKYCPTTLYGGHKDKLKERNMRRFQEESKYRVMLANINTAGTAINLTASSNVAFIELDWVPGNNAQAVMRCHRIGQNKNVYVRIFSLKDGIDQRISYILRRKMEDMTRIIDNTTKETAMAEALKQLNTDEKLDFKEIDEEIKELL